MRSKTSCFNSAMVRHDMRRYWPLWAACLFFCVVLMPVTKLYNPGLSTLASLRGSGWVLEVAITAIFSAFLAVAVFSPLYSAKASGFYGALPVRRETWFVSAWLSGFFMLVGCAAVTALLMLGVELSCGDVELWETLLWVGKYILLALFFYGLASLCALLTGTLWVVPLLYGVVNFIAYLIWVAVCYVCEMLTKGWVNPDGTLIAWLTPVVKIAETEGRHDLWVLIVYAVSGLAMAALAFRSMKKRRMENATDIVAVRALRPIFRWAGGICGGLFTGVILYAIFLDTSEGHIFQMMLFELIGVAIGWFGAEMLNRRSFRVWRKIPGFVLCAVFVLGFTFCCRHGCFGYERYIPKEETILSVECNDYGRGWGVSTDAEDIRAFTELHEDVRHRESEDGHTIELIYTLKNGTRVRRSYSLQWGDFTGSEQSLLKKMEINGMLDAIDRSTEYNAWIDITWASEKGYSSVTVDPKRFLKDVLVPGIQSGDITLYQGEGNRLEISITSSYNRNPNDDLYRNYRFHVTESAVKRIQAYF